MSVHVHSEDKNFEIIMHSDLLDIRKKYLPDLDGDEFLKALGRQVLTGLECNRKDVCIYIRYDGEILGVFGKRHLVDTHKGAFCRGQRSVAPYVVGAIPREKGKRYSFHS